MNITNLGSITKNLEQYKALSSSLSMAKASSLASTSKTLGLTGMIKSNENLFKVFDSNNIWGNQISSIQSMAKAYEAAIKPFTDNKPNWLSQSQEIQKSIDSILKPLGLSQISSFASTSKMLGIGSTIHDNANLFKILDKNNIWGNQLKYVELQSKLTNLVSSSHVDLLNEMMISMKNQPVAVLNADYTPSEAELIQATEIFYEESNQISFLDKFSKLPAFLQIAIFSFLMNFIYDVSANIAANLATPYIEQFLTDHTKASNIDKIRVIKKAPKKVLSQNINISHLRFITAKNGLNVRSDPSTTKSKIKDTIHIGQIVEVLDKRKNWIKISYKKDHKRIKGWVFTRYTKRFDP